MREKINKNLYRAILIISFLAANALIIFGISSVWGFLNTGADRSKMLHTEIQSTRLYFPKISWDTTAYKGRPMEKQSLGEIEKDYLNSWYVRNLALQTNKAYGIDDYYTDSARVNLYKTISFNQEQDVSFKTTSMAHHPELKFYSADGQLVVFEDQNVIEYSESYDGTKILDRTVDTSSYQVMMLLEDGFWRIRHMIKKPADAVLSSKNESALKNQNSEVILVDGKPFEMKGINYYPKDSPWDMFGDSFAATIIDQDFKIISDAGLNTVRIFIQYEDFGKADVNEGKLAKLNRTLDLADKNGLKVLVTLFDFYGDYSVLDWTITHEHARQVVSAVKDHKALLGWDIKNEPDLDFENRGKKLVLNWLKYTIAQIRAVDHKNLITIGWSNLESAALLQSDVDFVSFHYYQEPEEFISGYNTLRKKVSKPVVLGEFGKTSYKGLWNPFATGEDGQVAYHKKMQAYFKKLRINFLSWTLYDFQEVPSSVVGRLPWRKANQKEYGFINETGEKKPSFSYINN